MDREAKRAWWRDHIERWRDSGLSQLAYCREHDLRPWQFTYWKRGLERPAAEDRSSLMPVRLVDESPASPAADAGVVVELEEGVRLRLSRGFDAAVLAEAVTALRRR